MTGFETVVLWCWKRPDCATTTALRPVDPFRKQSWAWLIRLESNLGILMFTATA